MSSRINCARWWRRRVSAGPAVASSTSILPSIRGNATARGRGGGLGRGLFISVPMRWLVRPSPAARLASGGSQRGIGRAELFAPVAWPYVLAPPDTWNVANLSRASPPILGVVSATAIMPRNGGSDKERWG